MSALGIRVDPINVATGSGAEKLGRVDQSQLLRQVSFGGEIAAHPDAGIERGAAR